MSSWATEAQSLLDKGEVKEAIVLLQKEIEIAKEGEKGSLEVILSIAYLRDQDHEKAFFHFLKALEEVPQVCPYQPSSAEKEAYEKGLKIYLTQLSSQSPKVTAEHILKEFSGLSESHPDYALIGFLVAAAQANLGEFESFFRRFYQSYQKAPDHYLADKTQSILYIKLLEKIRDVQERQKYRLAIQTTLSSAIEKYPYDTSLYKLLLLFSEDEGKMKTIEGCLNKILNLNIVIPRCDLMFYIEEAIEHNRRDLAQKLIDKARGWYPISRLVDSAQEYIDQTEVFHD
jgi:tetratricopeptide (TPR) repeat protein